jgi:Tol biopolymer transport system component
MVVVLLAALTVGLVALLDSGSATEQMAQGGVAAPEQQAPTPTSTLSAPPMISQAEPTWTPSPTWTPFPTFTPRPTLPIGPTATPYPTRVSQENSEGAILYIERWDSGQSVQALTTNASGEKTSEPEAFRFDFDPILGSASPDGRYLVLLKPVFPVGEPYLFDLQTEQTRPIFRAQSMPEMITGQDYGWHPDGRHILFWHFGNDELWFVDVFTGEHKVLAYTHGPPQGAAISPDGQKVVYGNRAESGNDAVWIVDTAGGGGYPLIELASMNNVYVFDWSPDGKWILYIGGSVVGSEDAGAKENQEAGPLRIISPDGRSSQMLLGPFLSGWGFYPEWSPDSQAIAFTGLDIGTAFGCAQKKPTPDWERCSFEGASIFLEDIGTGEVRKFAPGIAPTWSPDGSLVAFLSAQGGGADIWTADINSGALQQLTTDALYKHSIIWMPKGG